MKKTKKAILKAQEVVKAEKSAMLETIKNVDGSIAAHDIALEEIDSEIKGLEELRAESLKAKREAIEYRNKLAEIIGE